MGTHSIKKNSGTLPVPSKNDLDIGSHVQWVTLKVSPGVNQNDIVETL